MPEKTKRKANPRRRTLMRLIMGMGVFIALIAGTIQVLRPKGAEIVYIAPAISNDEGWIISENIWLMNLNNTDHPQQLTDFSGFTISNLQTSTQGHVAIYLARHIDSSAQKIYHLDTKSGLNKLIWECESLCGRLDLHHSGKWLTFTTLHENSVTFMVLDIIEERASNLHEYSQDDMPSATWYDAIQWVGQTNLLAYRVNTSETEDLFVFYDYVEQGIVGEQVLYTQRSRPHFSDDGLQYVVNPESGRYPPLKTFVHTIETGESLQISYPNTDWDSESFWILMQDWHPDNINYLVIDINPHCDCEMSRLILINSNTGDAVTLATRNLAFADVYTYNEAYFNFNASKIIIATSTNSFGGIYSPLSLYDVQTGDETIFPIAGRYPQWVNGGR